MSWNKMDNKEEEDDEPIFTEEEIGEWINEGRDNTSSNLCIGIYGWEGTGKSGVAMDCRTEEDKEAGKEVIVIDLDDSCSSLKKRYFNNDDNISVIDPLVFDDEGDIDAPLTYEKVNYLVNHIYQNQDEYNLHAVILDGVDTFKDICGDKMQIEDLNMDPNARVKNSWNWQIRNRYYKNVMQKIKKMDCHRFFITHYKDKKKPVDGELQVVGKEINWHWSTDGMLFQKVEMRVEEDEEKGEKKFYAKVEKSKGALELETDEYLVAEVGEETEWYGLMDYYKKVW